MDRVINYIKSWFAPIEQPTRKRRVLDDFEFEDYISPKFRRINLPVSNGFLDEDLFGFPTSFLRRPSVSTQTARKSRTGNHHIMDSICLDDDDDDVVEVTPPKEAKNGNRSRSKYASTPADKKDKTLVNGDDDVQFIRDFKLPSSNKKSKTPQNANCRSYCSPNSRPNGTKLKPKVSPIITGLKTTTPGRNVKHSAALDVSYRLDDKLKYRQLLERAAPNYTSSSNDSSLYQTPLGKLFNYDSSSRGRKILGMVGSSSKEKTGDFVRKVLDGMEKEPIEVTDSDSDVEFVPPPSPKPDIKVEPVNSLKPVIDSSKPSKQQWLDHLVHNHREKIKRRQTDIDEYTKQFNALHDINTDIRIGTLAHRVDRSLSIKDYVLPEEEKEEEPELPELTEEHHKVLKRAFSGNPHEVLVKKFNLNITRRDILTLSNLNWLNDEVINFYMNLITERSKDHPRFPKVYTMNTFFFPKLAKDGPESLRRWTKRVDIFSYDLICVPIHLGVHWCMAVIDFRQKSIRYYDSMGGNNPECTKRLKRYLEHEHRDKKKTEYDTSDFTLEDVKDIPQQMNGSDCGMFSCMFAEYLSRDAKITFTQENMPYFRKKMVIEIVSGELMIK